VEPARHRVADAARDVQENIGNLCHRGVDFLAFKYDRGTPVLMGYATNQIEELSPSQQDDELRWKVYYAIYTDPFLSKYAPGGIVG